MKLHQSVFKPGVSRTAHLTSVDLTTLTGDTVYSQHLQSQVVLHRPMETRYFPGREAHRPMGSEVQSSISQLLPI
jgi:hypothetical protein